MKPSMIIAMTTVLLSSPAFAGSALAVPQCGYEGHHEAVDSEAFAETLHLAGKFGASVTIWDGCYKVQYLENGKTVTEYYDPDSSQRVY